MVYILTEGLRESKYGSTPRIYIYMRHLKRITESQSIDFYETNPNIEDEVEGLSDEITTAEQQKIIGWFEAVGIKQDFEMYAPHRAYDVPEDNYMVFNNVYWITDSTRFTVDVVKLVDDYWILKFERWSWNPMEDDWLHIGIDRAYRCDDQRGLKAAFDATVGRLATEYLNLEKMFDAARKKEEDIADLDEEFARIPKDSRKK
jgi:hypothetical protein